MCIHLSDVSVPCREQQGGGGGHDAGVVHAGQQEERPHQTTEPALPAVRQTHTHTHTRQTQPSDDYSPPSRFTRDRFSSGHWLGSSVWLVNMSDVSETSVNCARPRSKV